MRFVHHRFLLAAGLLCLSALAARAGEYSYPKSLPVLSVTVPDAWKVAEQPGPAHLIVCTTPQDANFVVSLMSLPASTTAADRDGILTRAARGAAESASLTEVTISGVTEEKIKQGARTFALVHASGKLKGTAATVVYAAFTLTDDGPYYLLGEAGPNASLAVHKEEFQKLANSIRPLQTATPAPTPVLQMALPAPDEPVNPLLPPTRPRH